MSDDNTASNTASTVDNTANTVDNTAHHKEENRGGARKMLSWQEKLALTERETVASFISCGTCGRECACIQKIRELGDEGVQMVVNLREQRMAGKNLDDAL